MKHITTLNGFRVRTEADFPVQCEEDISVINVFRRQARLHAHSVFLRYQVGDEFRTLTYAETDKITTNLAYQWKHDMGLVSGEDIIGFLFDQTVDYIICMITLLKLQVIFMNISPRNPEASLTHLAQEAKFTRMFVGQKYLSVAQSAVAKLDVKIHALERINIDHLLSVDHKAQIEFKPAVKSDCDKPVIYIHTSGSTSHPKPVWLTNRYLFFGMQSTLFHAVNTAPNCAMFEGQNNVMFSCFPLYHMAGIIGNMMMVIAGGSNVFLEKFLSSPTDILKSLKTNKVETCHLPPFILEQFVPILEEHPQEYAPLQALKCLATGGGKLDPAAGMNYAKNGVNIVNVYGTSESSMTMAGDPRHDVKKQWSLLRPFAAMQAYVAWEPLSESSSEKILVIKKGCPSLSPNIQRRENGDWVTRDVFIESSPGSNWWHYSGRCDDIFVLNNGENVNPVPMESALRRSDIIRYCTVIGEHRPCVATLIELEYSIASGMTPQEMISRVTEAVNEANREAPSYSHILSEMVYILPFERHLPHTDKGSVPRKKAILEFSDEVEQLYSSFLNGLTDGRISPDIEVNVTNPESVRAAIIKEAAKVLSVNPAELRREPHRSLFDFGLNSLRSIELRNNLVSLFGPHKIPQNFLYEYPTVNDMVQRITPNSVPPTQSLPSSRSSSSQMSSNIEIHYEQTEQILGKYLHMAKKEFTNVRTYKKSSSRDEVVFLTGATGSMGSFLLHRLAAMPRVKKIYVAVRGGDAAAAQQKLKEALQKRKLDSSILTTGKVKVLAVQMNDKMLGLSEDVYKRVKKETTIIQACGWLLDFYHTISHYDLECILGLYHLLKLAHREKDPMHLHFISSISASVNWKKVIKEKPLPRDPHVAMPMGYSQSKYIVEHLLRYMAVEKNMPCFIQRIGQVCGDSVHGIWNESEQFPIMIAGGAELKKLPQLDMMVDWLPVDYVADYVADIMITQPKKSWKVDENIFHIVHPRPLKWSQILEALRKSGLKFTTVSPEEWISDLQQQTKNPAYKMLPYYEASFTQMMLRNVEWKVDRTSSMTTINKLPTLSPNLFKKCVEHWKQTGFLPAV